MSDVGQRAVHEAISRWLDDGEIAICWTLTVDVAGQDGERYLAHRAGGGSDGSESPMAWTALGMLESSANLAREQLSATTIDREDDDDEDESS